MDDSQHSLPKAVESPWESGAHWATITGLILVLPYAISHVLTMLLLTVGLGESNWLSVFIALDVGFSLLYLPGVVLVIIGFVIQRGRRRLVWIAVGVALAPWFVTGLLALFRVLP